MHPARAYALIQQNTNTSLGAYGSFWKFIVTFGSLWARSHDPFLRIRFLVPKTGSRRSDGPISRFRFCGENVGRSFVVCSHDPFFRTNKESLIWRQNDHAKFVSAFHLSRRVSDENRACSISIRFFKITDPFDGRLFLMCSQDKFFGTNKNQTLKDGSCEQAFWKFRRVITCYNWALIDVAASPSCLWICFDYN